MKKEKVEEKVDETIQFLEKVEIEREGRGLLSVDLEVTVCVDCKEVISEEYKPKPGHFLHRNHTTLTSDVDRDEIGDWLNALKWVSKKCPNGK